LAISRDKKEAMIAEYRDLVGKSQAMIIAKYGGMTMPQFDKARKQVRDAKGEFHVVKNTLFARVLKENGLEVPDKWLTGNSAVSFCFEDPSAGAKASGDLAKDIDKFSLVGGVLSGKAIDAKGVEALASMPSLPVLRAQLIGLLQTPATNIVSVLNAAIGGVAYALQAKVDKEQPAA
jgi:large subunit ribosomal protein L10